jgi:hypothetical protein
MGDNPWMDLSGAKAALALLPLVVRFDVQQVSMTASKRITFMRRESIEFQSAWRRLDECADTRFGHSEDPGQQRAPHFVFAITD